MKNFNHRTSEDRLTALAVSSAQASQTINLIAYLDVAIANLKTLGNASNDPDIQTRLKAAEKARTVSAQNAGLLLEIAWDSYYLSLPFRKKHEARQLRDEWIHTLNTRLIKNSKTVTEIISSTVFPVGSSTAE